MKIYDLKVTNLDDKLILSAVIDSEVIGLRDLWFSVPKEYENYVCSTQMDAFLLGVLFPAMQYGEDIYVEGTISKKLLLNINKEVIPLLNSFSPSTKKIKVSAKNINDKSFSTEGIGTGFSGGVDSFCSIYDLLIKQEDPILKVNTLLFFNVGSHGMKEETAKRLCLQRYFHLKSYPKEIDIDYIFVDSNLHTFHPWGHEKIHILTSTAATLILQKHFSKYYYASAGLNYEQLIDFGHKYRDKAIAPYCEPILLPLLSTESTEFYSEGVAYNRVDKIVNISNYEPTFRYLNVCISGEDTHENCSTCSKCLRTLFALELSGNLENYNKVFDINKYKKYKKYYISQIILDSKKDIVAKSLIDLSKEKKIKLPNKLVSKLNVFFYRKIIKNRIC